MCGSKHNYYVKKYVNKKGFEEGACNYFAENTFTDVGYTRYVFVYNIIPYSHIA